MAVAVITGVVWEDSGATFLARITGNLGTAITQASISTITVNVFDLAAPGTVVLTVSVPVTAVSNTIVAGDPRWTKDSTGYNFLYTLAAAAFPTGNRKYRVSFLFVPVTGPSFPAVYDVDALNLFSS